MITAAISTHKGYEPYLERCVESCAAFCDEVVVYDDGGECDYFGGRHVRLEHSGSLIPARLRAIAECETEHLIHIDGDDYLVRRPEPQGDISFGDLWLTDGEAMVGMWEFASRPTDMQGVTEFYRQTQVTPFPFSKACFCMEWVRAHGLSWYRWPNTTHAEDARTLLEYLKHDPDIRRIGAYYAYRVHGDQMSGDHPQREVYRSDLLHYLGG